MGVDLNTASLGAPLLRLRRRPNRWPRRSSGIGTRTVPLPTRKALLKVPRFGAKAFEQSAGFLRIRGGTHPLDNTAVHPERYPLVEAMAATWG